MKVAVVSDIHANLEALVACFDVVDREGADVIACLGDIVGYGANPNECVQMVRERVQVVVAGNHDYAAVGKTDIDYFNPDALSAVLWTREALTADTRAYLESLAIERVVGELRFVHASPSHPADWNYVRNLREATQELAAFGEAICFIGHSHFPEFFLQREKQVERLSPPAMTIRPGDRALVNVGSVGQPRDRDPRAAFAFYDDATGRVVIRRVPYDVESVRDRILQTELPRSAGERLVWGL